MRSSILILLTIMCILSGKILCIECDSTCAPGKCYKPNDPMSCFTCLNPNLSPASNTNYTNQNSTNGTDDNLTTPMLNIVGISPLTWKPFGQCIKKQECVYPKQPHKINNLMNKTREFCLQQISYIPVMYNSENIVIHFDFPIYKDINKNGFTESCLGLIQTYDGKNLRGVPIQELNCIFSSDWSNLFIFINNPNKTFKSLNETWPNNNSTENTSDINSTNYNNSDYYDLSFEFGVLSYFPPINNSANLTDSVSPILIPEFKLISDYENPDHILLKVTPQVIIGQNKLLIKASADSILTDPYVYFGVKELERLFMSSNDSQGYLWNVMEIDQDLKGRDFFIATPISLQGLKPFKDILDLNLEHLIVALSFDKMSRVSGISKAIININQYIPNNGSDPENECHSSCVIKQCWRPNDAKACYQCSDPPTDAFQNDTNGTQEKITSQNTLYIIGVSPITWKQFGYCIKSDECVSPKMPFSTYKTIEPEYCLQQISFTSIMYNRSNILVHFDFPVYYKNSYQMQFNESCFGLIQTFDKLTLRGIPIQELSCIFLSDRSNLLIFINNDNMTFKSLNESWLNYNPSYNTSDFNSTNYNNSDYFDITFEYGALSYTTFFNKNTLENSTTNALFLESEFALISDYENADYIYLNITPQVTIGENTLVINTYNSDHSKSIVPYFGVKELGRLYTNPFVNMSNYFYEVRYISKNMNKMLLIEPTSVSLIQLKNYKDILDQNLEHLIVALTFDNMSKVSGISKAIFNINQNISNNGSDAPHPENECHPSCAENQCWRTNDSMACYKCANYNSLTYENYTIGSKDNYTSILLSIMGINPMNWRPYGQCIPKTECIFPMLPYNFSRPFSDPETYCLSHISYIPVMYNSENIVIHFDFPVYRDVGKDHSTESCLGLIHTYDNSTLRGIPIKELNCIFFPSDFYNLFIFINNRYSKFKSLNETLPNNNFSENNSEINYNNSDYYDISFEFASLSYFNYPINVNENSSNPKVPILEAEFKVISDFEYPEQIFLNVTPQVTIGQNKLFIEAYNYNNFYDVYSSQATIYFGVKELKKLYNMSDESSSYLWNVLLIDRDMKAMVFDNSIPVPLNLEYFKSVLDLNLEHLIVALTYDNMPRISGFNKAIIKIGNNNSNNRSDPEIECHASCKNWQCWRPNDPMACYQCSDPQSNLFQNGTNRTQVNMSSRMLLNILGISRDTWKPYGYCIEKEECVSPKWPYPVEYYEPAHCLQQISYIPIMYNRSSILIHFDFPLYYKVDYQMQFSESCVGLIRTYDQKTLRGVPIQELNCIFLSNWTYLYIFINNNSMTFKSLNETWPNNYSTNSKNSDYYDITFEYGVLSYFEIFSQSTFENSSIRSPDFLEAEFTLISDYETPDQIYLNVTPKVKNGESSLIIETYNSDHSKSVIPYFNLKELERLYMRSYFGNISNYRRNINFIINEMKYMQFDKPSPISVMGLLEDEYILHLNLEHLIVALSFDNMSRVTGISKTIININQNFSENASDLEIECHASCENGQCWKANDPMTCFKCANYNPLTPENYANGIQDNDNSFILNIMGISPMNWKPYGQCIAKTECIYPMVPYNMTDYTNKVTKTYCLRQVTYIPVMYESKNIMIHFDFPVYRNVANNKFESCLGLIQTYDNATLRGISIKDLRCIFLPDYSSLLIFIDSEYSSFKSLNETWPNNNPTGNNSNINFNNSDYYDISFESGSLSYFKASINETENSSNPEVSIFQAEFTLISDYENPRTIYLYAHPNIITIPQDKLYITDRYANFNQNDRPLRVYFVVKELERLFMKSNDSLGYLWNVIEIDHIMKSIQFSDCTPVPIMDLLHFKNILDLDLEHLVVALSFDSMSRVSGIHKDVIKIKGNFSNNESNPEKECHPSCSVDQCWRPNDPTACIKCFNYNPFTLENNANETQENFNFSILSILGISPMNWKPFGQCIPKTKCVSPMVPYNVIDDIDYPPTTYCLSQISYIPVMYNNSDIIIHFDFPVYRNEAQNRSTESCLGLIQTYDNITLRGIPIQNLRCIFVPDHYSLLIFSNNKYSSFKDFYEVWPNNNSGENNFDKNYNNSDYYDITFEYGSLSYFKDSISNEIQNSSNPEILIFQAEFTYISVYINPQTLDLDLNQQQITLGQNGLYIYFRNYNYYEYMKIHPMKVYFSVKELDKLFMKSNDSLEYLRNVMEIDNKFKLLNPYDLKPVPLMKLTHFKNILDLNLEHLMVALSFDNMSRISGIRKEVVNINRKISNNVSDLEIECHASCEKGECWRANDSMACFKCANYNPLSPENNSNETQDNYNSSILGIMGISPKNWKPYGQCIPKTECIYPIVPYNITDYTNIATKTYCLRQISYIPVMYNNKDIIIHFDFPVYRNEAKNRFTESCLGLIQTYDNATLRGIPIQDLNCMFSSDWSNLFIFINNNYSTFKSFNEVWPNNNYRDNNSDINYNNSDYYDISFKFGSISYFNYSRNETENTSNPELPIFQGEFTLISDYENPQSIYFYLNHHQIYIDENELYIEVRDNDYNFDLFYKPVQVYFGVKELDKLFMKGNNSLEYLRNVMEIEQIMKGVSFFEPRPVPLFYLKHFTNILDLNLQHIIVSVIFDSMNRISGISKAIINISNYKRNPENECHPSCEKGQCWRLNDPMACFSCIEFNPFTLENNSNGTQDNYNSSILKIIGISPINWKPYGQCIPKTECIYPMVPYNNFTYYDTKTYCLSQISYNPVMYNSENIIIKFDFPVYKDIGKNHPTESCLGLIQTYDQATLRGIPIQDIYCIFYPNLNILIIFIKNNHKHLKFKSLNETWPNNNTKENNSEIKYNNSGYFDISFVYGSLSYFNYSMNETENSSNPELPILQAQFALISDYIYPEKINLYVITPGVIIGENELQIQAIQYYSNPYSGPPQIFFGVKDLERLFLSSNDSLEYLNNVMEIDYKMKDMRFDLIQSVPLMDLIHFESILDLNLQYLVVALSFDANHRITGISKAVITIKRKVLYMKCDPSCAEEQCWRPNDPMACHKCSKQNSFSQENNTNGTQENYNSSILNIMGISPMNWKPYGMCIPQEKCIFPQVSYTVFDIFDFVEYTYCLSQISFIPVMYNNENIVIHFDIRVYKDYEKNHPTESCLGLIKTYDRATLRGIPIQDLNCIFYPDFSNLLIFINNKGAKFKSLNETWPNNNTGYNNSETNYNNSDYFDISFEYGSISYTNYLLYENETSSKPVLPIFQAQSVVISDYEYPKDIYLNVTPQVTIGQNELSIISYVNDYDPELTGPAVYFGVKELDKLFINDKKSFEYLYILNDIEMSIQYSKFYESKSVPLNNLIYFKNILDLNLEHLIVALSFDKMFRVSGISKAIININQNISNNESDPEIECHTSCAKGQCWKANDAIACYICSKDNPLSPQNYTNDTDPNNTNWIPDNLTYPILSIFGISPMSWRPYGQCIQINECVSPKVPYFIKDFNDTIIETFCLQQISYLPVMYDRKNILIHFDFPVYKDKSKNPFTESCQGLIQTPDGQTLRGVPIQDLNCIFSSDWTNLFIFINNPNITFKSLNETWPNNNSTDNNSDINSTNYNNSNMKLGDYFDLSFEYGTLSYFHPNNNSANSSDPEPPILVSEFTLISDYENPDQIDIYATPQVTLGQDILSIHGFTYYYYKPVEVYFGVKELNKLFTIPNKSIEYLWSVAEIDRKIKIMSFYNPTHVSLKLLWDFKEILDLNLEHIIVGLTYDNKSRVSGISKAIIYINQNISENGSDNEIECHPSCAKGQCWRENDSNACYECPNNYPKPDKPLLLGSLDNSDNFTETFLFIHGIFPISWRPYGECIVRDNCSASEGLVDKMIHNFNGEIDEYCLRQVSFLPVMYDRSKILVNFDLPVFPNSEIWNYSESCKGLIITSDNITLQGVSIDDLSCLFSNDWHRLLIVITNGSKLFTPNNDTNIFDKDNNLLIYDENMFDLSFQKGTITYENTFDPQYNNSNLLIESSRWWPHYSIIYNPPHEVNVYLNVTPQVTLGQTPLAIQSYAEVAPDEQQPSEIYFNVFELGRLLSNSNNSHEYLSEIAYADYMMKGMTYMKPQTFNLSNLYNFTNILDLNLAHSIVAVAYDNVSRVTGISTSLIRINQNITKKNDTNNTDPIIECHSSCEKERCMIPNDPLSCYMCSDNPVNSSNTSSGNLTMGNLLNVLGVSPFNWKPYGKCVSRDFCVSPMIEKTITYNSNYSEHYCLNQISFISSIYNKKHIIIYFDFTVFPNLQKWDQTESCVGLLVTNDSKTLRGIPIENLSCLFSAGYQSLVIFNNDPNKEFLTLNETLNINGPNNHTGNSSSNPSNISERYFDISFSDDIFSYIPTSNNSNLTSPLLPNEFLSVEKVIINEIESNISIYLQATPQVSLNQTPLEIQAFSNDSSLPPLIVEFRLKELSKLYSNTNNSQDYLKAVENIDIAMKFMEFTEPNLVPLNILEDFKNVLALNLEHKVAAYALDTFNKVIGFSMASVRINYSNPASNKTDPSANCTLSDKEFCTNLTGICFPYSTNSSTNYTFYADYLLHSKECLKAVGPYCYNKYQQSQISMNAAAFNECDPFFNKLDYIQVEEGLKILDNDLHVTWADYSTFYNPILLIKFNTSVELNGSIYCNDYFNFMTGDSTNSFINMTKKECTISKMNPYDNSINFNDNYEGAFVLTFSSLVKEVKFTKLEILPNKFYDSLFMISIKNPITLYIDPIPELQIWSNYNKTSGNATQCSLVYGNLINYSESIYSNVIWYVSEPIPNPTIAKSINNSLNKYINQSYFSIDPIYTASLESLTIYASYETIEGSTLISATSILFDQSENPVIRSTLSNSEVFLYENDTMDVYLKVEIASSCTNINESKLISNFTVAVYPTRGNNSLKNDINLASKYSSSLSKFGKIGLSKIQLTTNYTDYNFSIEITPILSSNYKFTPPTEKVNVYIMEPLPEIKILGPSIISSSMKSANFTIDIVSPTYYKIKYANSNLTYTWECPMLNISSIGQTLIIQNFTRFTFGKNYECSALLLKDNVFQAFAEFSFLLTKGEETNLFPDVHPIIEDSPKEIIIKVPSANLTSSKMNMTWVLAEVSNDSITYGNITQMIDMYSSYFISKDYSFVNKGKNRILANNSDPSSNSTDNNNSEDSNKSDSYDIIPKELNILNDSTQMPFLLILKKDAKFNGYAYKILFIATDIKGAMQMGIVEISLLFKLNNVTIIPSKPSYSVEEPIDLQIINPGINSNSQQQIIYSLDRLDCPESLKRDNPDSLIDSIPPTSQITIKNTYPGNKECNYSVMIILTQKSGYSISTNNITIQITPKKNNATNSTSGNAINLTEVSESINNLKNELNNMEINDQIKSVSDLTKTLLNDMNISSNSSNPISNADIAAYNKLVDQLLDLIDTVLDNLLNSLDVRLLRLLEQGNTQLVTADYTSTVNKAIDSLKKVLEAGIGSLDNNLKMKHIATVEKIIKLIETYSLNKAENIKYFPRIIDVLMCPYKNSSNGSYIPMPNNDFKKFRKTIIKLLRLYAISVKEGEVTNVENLNFVKINIYRQSLSSYTSQAQSISFENNKQKFKVNIPNFKGALESFENKLSSNGTLVQGTDSAIINSIFMISNENNLTSDDNTFAETYPIPDLDSVYMEHPFHSYYTSVQVKNDFSNPEKRKEYSQTDKLVIDFAISKVNTNGESLTNIGMGLCESAGQTFTLNIPDPLGSSGIKIPAFINNNGKVSVQGFKVKGYDNATKSIIVEWTIPKCQGGNSRLLDSSEGTMISVFSYTNPNFINSLDIATRYRLLWISLGLFGLACVIFVVQLILHKSHLHEYINKACSSSKRLNTILRKQPPEGCAQGTRVDRLYNILASASMSQARISAYDAEKNYQSESPEKSMPDSSIAIMPISELSDSPDKLKNHDIIVDASKYENDVEVMTKAYSLCDIERETTSSFCFFVFLEEHILSGAFLTTNLRYPNYLRTTDLISTLISIIVLSGIFINYTTQHYVLCAIYAALINSVLSYISRRLLVGGRINFRMALVDLESAFKCNRYLAIVGFLLNVVRTLGGIVIIILLCSFLAVNLLNETIPLWTYSFLVGFAIDLFALETIKILIQMMALHLSTISMENRNPNCIGSLIVI